MTTMQQPMFVDSNLRHFGGKKTKEKKQEKAQKEKDQIKEEFADVDTDDIKSKFVDELEEVLFELEENLASRQAFLDMAKRASADFS